MSSGSLIFPLITCIMITQVISTENEILSDPIRIQSGPFVSRSDENEINNLKRRELTLPDTLSTSDKQAILDLHNEARNNVSGGTFASILEQTGFLPPATDMEEVIWDPALEAYAMDIASWCAFGHQGSWSTDNLNMNIATFVEPTGASWKKGLGENLAYSSAQPTIDVLLDLTLNGWIIEGKYWGFGSIDGSDSFGPAYAGDERCNASDYLNTNGCGHFTQIIWANTRYIGCGFYDCGSGGIAGVYRTQLVCLYYRQGNFVTQDPYSDSSTTQCANCDSDRDNNCDSGDSVRNNLCAGGLDSSFENDGGTDIDVCENGLGVTISNACGTPTTSNPTTAFPTTANPTTAAPITASPTTANPTTSSPTTASPTTDAPTTDAPTTDVPTTDAPTTDAPTTDAPTTGTPTTASPTTASPTTDSPTTAAPTTATPTTANPTTAQPTTSNPTTANPTTDSPTTSKPTTDNPTEMPTPSPTDMPTDIGEIICGAGKNGQYSGGKLLIELQLGYYATIRFDARSTTEFTITNITAFDFTGGVKGAFIGTDGGTGDNSPGVDLLLRFTDQSPGDYLFQIEGVGTGEYIISTRCVSDSPTRAPSIDPTKSPTPAPTSDPTPAPTKDPTSYPTNNPTQFPSDNPTTTPTNDPTFDPSNDPTIDPTIDPTTDPTIDPTSDPSKMPSMNPTVLPSTQPSKNPTESPTPAPTDVPSYSPSLAPSLAPTSFPTFDPTTDPTTIPSKSPTIPGSPTTSPTNPTFDPTNDPTIDPTIDPTNDPTEIPTTQPSSSPSTAPSLAPTENPTQTPSNSPTPSPTNDPSSAPTNAPSLSPTKIPTPAPTSNPTAAPSAIPSEAPSSSPTLTPTSNPTPAPTEQPTDNPITPGQPTFSPTDPTESPTDNPSVSPTPAPTDDPTPAPTNDPSFSPSMAPTAMPTNEPTSEPSKDPTPLPTDNPITPGSPTSSPTDVTTKPTSTPTEDPTTSPSNSPVVVATNQPSSISSENPTLSVTDDPTTSSPSMIPTPSTTDQPTDNPIPPGSPTSSPSKQTMNPSRDPSKDPTITPTDNPTLLPTVLPTNEPTPSPTSVPSRSPLDEGETFDPTEDPTLAPTSSPTDNPTPSPTDIPVAMTSSPSMMPSANPTSLSPTEIPSISPIISADDKCIFRWLLRIKFRFKLSDNKDDTKKKLRSSCKTAFYYAILQLLWKDVFCFDLFDNQLTLDAVATGRRLLQEDEYAIDASFQYNDDLQDVVFDDDAVYDETDFLTTFAEELCIAAVDQGIIDELSCLNTTSSPDAFTIDDPILYEVEPSNKETEPSSLSSTALAIVLVLAFIDLIIFIGCIIWIIFKTKQRLDYDDGTIPWIDMFKEIGTKQYLIASAEIIDILFHCIFAIYVAAKFKSYVGYIMFVIVLISGVVLYLRYSFYKKLCIYQANRLRIKMQQQFSTDGTKSALFEEIDARQIDIGVMGILLMSVEDIPLIICSYAVGEYFGYGALVILCILISMASVVMKIVLIVKRGNDDKPSVVGRTSRAESDAFNMEKQIATGVHMVQPSPMVTPVQTPISTPRGIARPEQEGVMSDTDTLNLNDFHPMDITDKQSSWLE